MSFRTHLLLLVFWALAPWVSSGAEIHNRPPARLSPAEAAREGRALVADILSQRPAQDLTNTGVLKIRSAEDQRTELPLNYKIFATPAGWSSVYRAGSGTNAVTLTVIHAEGRPNLYRLTRSGTDRTLSGNETMIPFAGSDFWVADLGLEFFQWPKQNVWRTEMRRGRSCRVLESVNPHPAPGAYSRVVSWIDIETDGIVHADAYDAAGRLLKEFNPKEFKKVKGQWQLQEMEIDNDQTGSRTWIEFNLGSGR